jgi:hypothetical protein
MYEVSWGAALAADIASRLPSSRADDGRPSESDFVEGALSAALVRFRQFETLPEEAGAAVRSAHIVDPIFGAVVFVGVLVGERQVEIVSFDFDADYWDTIRGDSRD